MKSYKSTNKNSYLQQIHTSVDNNRHLSTIYTQDIHSQKDDKTDIFRHLSPLSTSIIIVIIIFIKKIYNNIEISKIRKKSYFIKKNE